MPRRAHRYEGGRERRTALVCLPRLSVRRWIPPWSEGFEEGWGKMAMGSGPARARALRPVEVAWIALVPWALVTFAALMLLGPPLGRAFFEPGSEALWPPGTPNTIG